MRIFDFDKMLAKKMKDLNFKLEFNKRKRELESELRKDKINKTFKQN